MGGVRGECQEYRVSTIHLICGLPCSGKTTYASQLHGRGGSVLFSLDRWLITLFDKYSISAVGHDEHKRRVLACRELIWEAAAELSRQSIDVILDDGYFLRDDRVRCITQAKTVGAAARTHFLEAPAAVIRTRLARRNGDLPRFNFYIDPSSLHLFLDQFERPTSEEGAHLTVVNTTAW
jgi:predicted kinase